MAVQSLGLNIVRVSLAGEDFNFLTQAVVDMYSTATDPISKLRLASIFYACTGFPLTDGAAPGLRAPRWVETPSLSNGPQ